MALQLVIADLAQRLAHSAMQANAFQWTEIPLFLQAG